jgi:hypothetical protein
MLQVSLRLSAPLEDSPLPPAPAKRTTVGHGMVSFAAEMFGHLLVQRGLEDRLG